MTSIHNSMPSQIADLARMNSRSAGTPDALQHLADSGETNASDDPLREAFQDFVGQTLFGSMLKQMRKTTGEPAYMHGGRAEEIFQEQMDQHIVEDLSDASAASISDPMYDLFNMQRRS